MEDQPIPTKYRELEQLDTETLKELIRTDCYTEDLDEECMLYALHIISSREQAKQGQDQEVDEAWRRFKEKYCTPEGAGQSLYDSSPGREAREETPARKRRPLRRLPRRVAVVAAVLCALFATLIVAQAAGLDLWGIFVQWSDETFRFTYQGDGPSSSWMEGREELKNMELNDYLPTWIPEGYTVEEVQTYELRDQSTAIILFSGENVPAFYLSVDVYEDLEKIQYATFEKDDAPVREQRLSNGATVYFYTNGGDEQSLLQYQNVVCSISGDISEESVIKIYESIEAVE